MACEIGGEPSDFYRQFHLCLILPPCPPSDPPLQSPCRVERSVRKRFQESKLFAILHTGVNVILPEEGKGQAKEKLRTEITCSLPKCRVERLGKRNLKRVLQIVWIACLWFPASASAWLHWIHIQCVQDTKQALKNSKVQDSGY